MKGYVVNQPTSSITFMELVERMCCDASGLANKLNFGEDFQFFLF